MDNESYGKATCQDIMLYSCAAKLQLTGTFYNRIKQYNILYNHNHCIIVIAPYMYNGFPVNLYSIVYFTTAQSISFVVHWSS